MKTYEQGSKDEQDRIREIIMGVGKELFVILNFGNFRDKRKARIALATLSGLLEMIEEEK